MCWLMYKKVAHLLSSTVERREQDRHAHTPIFVVIFWAVLFSEATLEHVTKLGVITFRVKTILWGQFVSTRR